MSKLCLLIEKFVDANFERIAHTLYSVTKSKYRPHLGPAGPPGPCGFGCSITYHMRHAPCAMKAVAKDRDRMKDEHLAA